MPASYQQPVIFFDGVCNFCNSIVRFIIKQDKQKKFLFAPLQSTYGIEAMKHIAHSIKIDPKTIILHYKDKYYTKFAAALQIASVLGGIWKILLAAYIIPGFIRNGLYDIIARNRYKWFGKTDTCMVPGEDIRSRFLTE